MIDILLNQDFLCTSFCQGHSIDALWRTGSEEERQHRGNYENHQIWIQRLFRAWVILAAVLVTVCACFRYSVFNAHKVIILNVGAHYALTTQHDTVSAHIRCDALVFSCTSATNLLLPLGHMTFVCCSMSQRERERERERERHQPLPSLLPHWTSAPVLNWHSYLDGLVTTADLRASNYCYLFKKQTWYRQNVFTIKRQGLKKHSDTFLWS